MGLEEVAVPGENGRLEDIGVDVRDGGDKVNAGRIVVVVGFAVDEGGFVRYCKPSLGPGVLLRRRAARRTMIVNCCSIATSRSHCSMTKSYSHSGPSESCSSIFTGLGETAEEPGVGGSVLVILLGNCGRSEATAGGTLRFNVEVCNLPASRYGAENQATSSRPRGKIAPGVYVGGKLEIGNPSSRVV
jgi:hypothetical protein